MRATAPVVLAGWIWVPTIELLNEHLNDHLYVSLLESNPQATVEDEEVMSRRAAFRNERDGRHARYSADAGILTNLP